MTRLQASWRDHTSTARREHVHGPVRPMERDGFTWGQLAMMGYMVGVTVGTIAACVWWAV